MLEMRPSPKRLQRFIAEYGRLDVEPGDWGLGAGARKMQAHAIVK